MKGILLNKKHSIFALSLLMAASFSPVSSIEYVQADTIQNEASASTESTTLTKESTTATTKSSTERIVYSTADDLNLREEPSTESKSLKKINAGDSMTVLSEKKNWYKVQSGKKIGYVSKLYTSEEWIGFSSTENLNLRKEPKKTAEVIDQFYQGDAMTVLSKEGKWYKVQYGDKTGYVSQKYVDFQCNVYVDGTNVNLRKSAHTESSVIKRLDSGDIVTLLAKEGNWYKVRYKKKVGYIRDIYLSFTEPVEEVTYATSSTTTSGNTNSSRNNSNSSNNKNSASSDSSGSSNNTGSSSLGQSIVNYAKQFLGNPYVYGGTSLTNGADCSGFVQSVYAHFGISLPRTSSAQRSAGYSVGSLSNAKPGDLICYYGHVGIYIGNNAIIHASNEKSGIKITYNAAYRQIASIRRVI